MVLFLHCQWLFGILAGWKFVNLDLSTPGSTSFSTSVMLYLLPQFYKFVQNLEALKMFLLTISETTVGLLLSVNISEYKYVEIFRQVVGVESHLSNFHR